MLLIDLDFGAFIFNHLLAIVVSYDKSLSNNIFGILESQHITNVFCFLLWVVHIEQVIRQWNK